MRYVGRITDWNDDKGFGFVTPNGGGDRAFVHIKAFERPSPRPVSGQLISYEPRKDERGRFNAAAIRLVTPQQEKRTSRRNGWPRKAIATLFLVALVIGWFLSRIPTIILLIYGAMSVLTFAMYGIDKSAAVNNRWRTQESTLHFAGLLGGWPGALFAQDVFHHKSRKAEFQFVFWVTTTLNCVALAWLLADGKATAINHAMFETMMGG
ncbi:MAG TPA: DUF1294 domain-containing protein [Rhodanobacter sp.]